MNNSAPITQIFEDPCQDTPSYINQNWKLELIPYGKIIYDNKMPVLLKINKAQVSETAKDFIFFIDQNIDQKYVSQIRNKVMFILGELSPQHRIGITSGTLNSLVLNSNDRGEEIYKMISSITIGDNNFNMFNQLKKLISQLSSRKYKNPMTCLIVFSNENKDFDLFNEALGSKLYNTFDKIFPVLVNEELNDIEAEYDEQWDCDLEDLMVFQVNQKVLIELASITVNIEYTYLNAELGKKQVDLYKFDDISKELLFMDVQSPSQKVQWIATLNAFFNQEIVHKQVIVCYDPLQKCEISEEVEFECVQLIFRELSDKIDQLTNKLDAESLIAATEMQLQFTECEASSRQKKKWLENLKNNCYEAINQQKLESRFKARQNQDRSTQNSHNYQPNLDEDLSMKNQVSQRIISINHKSQSKGNRFIKRLHNTDQSNQSSITTDKFNQSKIPSEYQNSNEHIYNRVAQRQLLKHIPDDINFPQQIEEQLNFIDENGFHYIGQGDPSNVRNGFGILKYDLDQEVYSGYWKDDLFHGNGKLQNYGPQQAQWVYYHGSFEYSKMEGNGIMQFQNGTSYQGGFTQGKANDLDLFIQLYVQSAKEEWDSNYQNLMKLLNDETLLARSHFRNVSDIQDGFGILEDEQGNRIYQWFWKNQQYHNFGIEHNQDVKFEVDGQEHYDWTKYIGQYQDGAKSGIGLIEYLDGVVYFGEIDNNRIRGYGKINIQTNEDIYNYYN